MKDVRKVIVAIRLKVIVILRDFSSKALLMLGDGGRRSRRGAGDPVLRGAPLRNPELCADDKGV